MKTAPLQIALDVLSRGWNPVRVSRKTKRAFDPEWQKRRFSRETAAQFFNGYDDLNVGVQFGPHSDGLCGS